MTKRHPFKTQGRDAFVPASEPANPRPSLWSLLLVVLAVLLPSFPAHADEGFVSCPAPGSLPLLTIPEIKRDPAKKTLQAVLKVGDEDRLLWFPSPNGIFCASQRLRFFTGGPTDNPQPPPTVQGLPEPIPGPTFRIRVGDMVNITFLNQIDVRNFGGSLDRGEQGLGCDKSNAYPVNDQMPNCFHGSSTANVHFHGFHTTPNTTGDNVLLMIRPSLRDSKGKPVVTEASVKDVFKQIFDRCAQHGPPTRWEQLPKKWQDKQEELLKKYDKTAPFQGKFGLPPEARLWPQNKMAIENGLWPQYQIGAYPYCFKVPEYQESEGKPVGLRMGQAPGTFWYHAHKHGSTALNVGNGMTGAFIIEGDYDDTLRAFYKPKGGLTEQVLVLQQLGVTQNLLSAKPGGPGLVSINGRLQPIVQMKPNEVQLWRIVNTSGRSGVQFVPPKVYNANNTTEWRRTALDGVQLSPENYASAANVTPQFLLASGNRVDLLVKAPATPGDYDLRYVDTVNTTTPPDPAKDPILLKIRVSAGASADMSFPSAQEFPKLPAFLKDIDPATVRIRREVTFNTEPFPGRAQTGAEARQSIDGALFSDQTISQSMLQDTAEEWTLISRTPGGPATGIAHPFHIHVNPFQIIEVFDPNDPNELKPNCYNPADPSTWKSCQPPLKPPFVWRDTIAIPASRLVTPEGQPPILIPGYVKIRHRFDDFPGQFVLHCHILGHEDRGMMQLIQVVPNKTMTKHH